jgi:hypothetical protein
MDLLYTVSVVVYRTKIHALTQVLPLKVDFIALSNAWAWTNGFMESSDGAEILLYLFLRGFWSKIGTTTV